MAEERQYAIVLNAEADNLIANTYTASVDMGRYKEIDFIITTGVTGIGHSNVYLQSCDLLSATGTNTKIAARYKFDADASGTAGLGTGVFSAMAVMTTTGFDTTTGINGCFVVNVIAGDLITGDRYARLLFTEDTDSPVQAEVIAIGYHGRTQEATMDSMVS